MAQSLSALELCYFVAEEVDFPFAIVDGVI